MKCNVEVESDLDSEELIQKIEELRQGIERKKRMIQLSRNARNKKLASSKQTVPSSDTTSANNEDASKATSLTNVESQCNLSIEENNVLKQKLPIEHKEVVNYSCSDKDHCTTSHDTATKSLKSNVNVPSFSSDSDLNATFTIDGYETDIASAKTTRQKRTKKTLSANACKRSRTNTELKTRALKLLEVVVPENTFFPAVSLCMELNEPSDFVLPSDFNKMKLVLAKASMKRSKNLSKSNELLAVPGCSKENIIVSNEEKPRSDELKSQEGSSRPRRNANSTYFFRSSTMYSCLEGTLDSPVLSIHISKNCNPQLIVICQPRVITVWSATRTLWKPCYEWNIEDMKNPCGFYYLETQHCLAIVVLSVPRTGPITFVYVYSKNGKTRTFKVKFSSHNSCWQRCLDIMGCVHDGQLVLAGMVKSKTSIICNCALEEDGNTFDIRNLTPCAKVLLSLTTINSLTNAVLGLTHDGFVMWNAQSGSVTFYYETRFDIEYCLWSSCEKGILFFLGATPDTQSCQLFAFNPDSNRCTQLRSYPVPNVEHATFQSVPNYFFIKNEQEVSGWNMCTSDTVFHLRTTNQLTAFAVSRQNNSALLAIGFDSGCVHLYR